MNLISAPTLKRLLPSFALSVLFGASALPFSSAVANAYSVYRMPSISVENIHGHYLLASGTDFTPGSVVFIRSYGTATGRTSYIEPWDKTVTVTAAYGICGSWDWRCPSSGTWQTEIPLNAMGCSNGMPFDLQIVATDGATNHQSQSVHVSQGLEVLNHC